MLQYKFTRIPKLGYLVLECYKDEEGSIFFNYDYSPFDMKKIDPYLDNSPLMKSILNLNKIINKNKKFLRDENQISEEQHKNCIGSLKAIPIIRTNPDSSVTFVIDYGTSYWLTEDFEQYLESPIVKGVADVMYEHYLPLVKNPEVKMKMPANLNINKRKINSG